MRVLIIDDQAVNREQLREMVTEFGYSPLTVESGEDALVVFNEFSPDLVLLDVMMPGLKGDEIAPQLKKLANQVHLPIIFITALDDKRTLLRCLEAGGDDFLSKPFDPLVLGAKLKAHLRTRKLSQTLEQNNKHLAYHSARIDREHRIVKRIFNNALNRNLGDYPYLSTLFLPLSVFNGDTLLTAASPIGNLYIFLGDFTGHGLAAAIGTLPASQTFYSMAARGAPVGQIATEINNRLSELLPEDMFCAAVLIELSASGQRLSYWNGGMNGPQLIGPEGEFLGELAPQHVALGILPSDQFDPAVTTLRVDIGSRVLLATDGLIELGKEHGQMLGASGLRLLLQHFHWEFNSVAHEIKALTKEWHQHDDITLALLECVPTGILAQVPSTDLSQLPFRVRCDMTMNEIRSQDPIASFLRAFEHIPGFKPHRSALFTLLSESYNNAIDHGLLRMDSRLKQSPDGFERYYVERERRLLELEDGLITIEVDYKPESKSLTFTVSDSGLGFLPQKGTNVAEENTEGAIGGEVNFGRGLSLIRELARDVQWLHGGRTICFVYLLQ
ncbi:SpoIIE family protein phosphatase [Aliidiomarina celeris]|uniref:SpoIIE family protein phosphatase n=1 Tax=Aliidiomarina celeris TaxID=2249428 RepID=UPI000DE9742C|nr:SpoIIE family protein phosphatase [Aliidiomarina celeris]